MRLSLRATTGNAGCIQASLAMKQLHSLQLLGCCKSRDLSSTTAEIPPTTTTAPHTLQGELPRQFLTSDGDTIVCVHPSLPVDFCDTKVGLPPTSLPSPSPLPPSTHMTCSNVIPLKPLHPYKPEMDLRRIKLNQEEVGLGM